MTEEPRADARDMFAVHTMFRREFGLMPGLIRATAAGDTRRAAVVADHAALLASILDLHHAGEDEHAWPRLRERGGAEIAAVVGVMEEQHEAIHKEYLRTTEAVAAWRDGAGVVDRDALAALVELLSSLLTTHLALEEAQVVPLIERYLTKAEYAQLAAEGAAHTPPGLLPVTLGMVLYEASPAVTGMILAELPAVVRPAFPKAANDAYAAYAERLYGTPTPPRATDGGL